MEAVATDPLIGYVVSVFLMIMTLTSLARFFGLGREQKSPVRLDPDQMKEWTRQQSVECGFQHKDIKQELDGMKEQQAQKTQILQSMLGNARQQAEILRGLQRDHEEFRKKHEHMENVVEHIRTDQMIDNRVQSDLEGLGKQLVEDHKLILKHLDKYKT
jgi:Zn ribbon nucleic-acid-binding protein